MMLIEYLKDKLRGCAAYNKSNQVAPAAILWTDIDKQWHAAMPFIKKQIPELIELGDYQPDERIGPAIWVKCAIANKLEECVLPEGQTPIIYLPGVGRKDLRAIEQCPEFLKPLAELQYRGCWWAYNSAGRDWTVSSFLANPKVGIALDIAKDKKTLDALINVLPELLETPVASLKGKKLEAEDFYSIVLDDPAKDILGWLNSPAGKQKQWSESKWTIFTEYCLSQFGFIPDSLNILAPLTLLCDAQCEWQSVWTRFEDTANNLPLLVEQLKEIKPDVLAVINPENYLSGNVIDEQSIESAFKTIEGKSKVDLEAEFEAHWQTHSPRKEWLWSRLGLSPWLAILEEVIAVFKHTKIVFSGSSPEVMAEHYSQRFWQADAAVLASMAKTRDIHQQELVANVLAVIYSPWLSETTINFQRLVAQAGYPGKNRIEEPVASYSTGNQVVFFVDGLRFDTAKMLEQKLSKLSIDIDLQPRWSALPSLTATAKAAVTPVADMLTGLQDNDNFIPALADGHATFSSHYLKKLLKEKGWQYLDGLETGKPTGYAWVQTGDLDNMGHKQQRKLPLFIDQILDDVVARIQGLLDAGWSKIKIVTDHGWLWVPDGLPKDDLNKSFGKNRQHRCAILKDNVQHDGLVVPWHWNENVSIAMAPGISAYVAGDYYNHGGLSLQECLTPELNIKIRN
ncbi:hypothetical protein PCNPT3_07980 [Psychromonas sp. CNPT3]|uniref:BREX-1 system phosphatase PglZ type B n=1 Tax=Psychromonas sp. CNPT3 TaxID=314282 RepID=UPI00006E56A2|nr:BREX-1 system phosphatase PglZ type B [Psychromonas sp. CNPT3]AGH81534.1 hypothetical protein PCNPT3_07980 [Psychromonas sp. CNPT3]